MRIVIDLQGAQSARRRDDIGRYALQLALGLARNAGPHELWLVLNDADDAVIEALRQAFAGLVAPERIVVFETIAGAGEAARVAANQAIREYFIARLRPDAVLVTSLFEAADDTVTSVGGFASGARHAVIVYEPASAPAAALRQAGLLLAVCDAVGRHAQSLPQLDARPVAVLAPAAEAGFQMAPLPAQQQLALRQRLGISRPLVVYEPDGGADPKRLDALIEAYSLLPQALRASHQLLLACRPDPAERRRLGRHAWQCGLAADELILPDDDDDAGAAECVRAAALCILPCAQDDSSPGALERAAGAAYTLSPCGAALAAQVIAGDAAWFDAAGSAMAARLAQALRGPGAGPGAAFATLCWNRLARRALHALESGFAAPAAAPAGGDGRKRRLAFVAPLPPERTGIADYAAQLLPALLADFDIELVTQQSELVLPAALAALPRRSAGWFAQNARHYDQIVYQFGNSTFHSHMFALLEAHPGVVVLHDFFLSNVLAHEETTGGMPNAWADALYHSHGYQAVQASAIPGAQEAAMHAYPCNLAVLENATGVIVHSEYARALARAWYGAAAADNWSVVPLPRARPPKQDRQAAREALGIRPEQFLVCSFGYIGPSKLHQELLQAWLDSSLHAEADCVLVLVGANHNGAYGARIAEMVRGAKRRISIAGWTDEAVYHQYLQAADLGVQLRSISRGETSAAVLDCMNYGLPTIINANGSMAELPDQAVWKLADSFSVAELRAALETLRNDPRRRAELGAQAGALLRTRHSPEHCAALYRQGFDRAHADAAAGEPALIARLGATLPLASDEPTLQQLARCIAAAPDPLAQRQLLVDVSAIAQHDLKTGIERVVRTQLLELLRLRVGGLRVEPVYLSFQDGNWHYRYARRYAHDLLGIEGGTLADSRVEVRAGDLFYSADYSPHAVPQAARDGLYAHWRARGVAINFLIHDLLPVLRPEFFPPGADQRHADWLACLAREADRLICISAAVRDETMAWLERQAPRRARRLELAVLHHGADIGRAKGAPAAPADAQLQRLRAAPSFLMVGTIEPRKGHLQALAAFEKLWREGMRINLIIVGGEGWKGLPAAARRTIPQCVERLRRHPELGKRLFWLQGLDDDYLQQVYLASSCLLAVSEGEGFGLPLIEAASYQLPLIARDIPVFREVAQHSAFYFSGLEADHLAGAVRDWLDLRERGAVPAVDTLQWRTWQDNTAELMAILAGERSGQGWPAQAA
jgi:glycosyltransferase involved in cell wall biosynthesis